MVVRRMSVMGPILTAIAALSLAACNGSSSVEDTGVVRMAVANVPADVTCLRVTAAAGQTVVRDLEVAPGDASVFMLQRLPVGEVTFSAVGLSAACASHPSSDGAAWISDPVK